MEIGSKERGFIPDLGRFWTVPNVLTLSRIVLAIPAAILIVTGGPIAIVLGLIVLAMATDWLDGRVARWSKSVSGWGKVLDPVVDKIGGGLIVLALAIKGSIPKWFIASLVGRDVLIVLGGIFIARQTGRVVISTWVGKAAVTAVGLTVLAALLEADPPVMQFCLTTATILLILSFIRYLWRFITAVRPGAVKYHADVADNAELPTPEVTVE